MSVGNTLQVVLDEDGQRLLQRYRDAYNRMLSTPEDKRGPKNGYKKVVSDMNAAACDFASWVEVITHQASENKADEK
ncbi:TPA: hypothetical protein L4619_002492 [Pseudomonas aeruginosa]|uniref:hypothetical protein n=1 Tax=Pseudomonas aeruginosa TaxID=287 RepID=UPI0012987DE4|nr:hypothetical protein [Pseudomonas aeruginosa]HBO5844714.1 hypothetical protein [Pseudomonas aeruginosa]HBO5911714.1 hypothetical protein [Pseudomonas aeruginosa]